MKKLSNLKLNQLTKIEMEKRQLKYLVGGNDCTCGCHYSGQGGSSLSSNDSANYTGDKYSYGGGNPSCSPCSNNRDNESDFWYGN